MLLGLFSAGVLAFSAGAFVLLHAVCWWLAVGCLMGWVVQLPCLLGVWWLFATGGFAGGGAGGAGGVIG